MALAPHPEILVALLNYTREKARKAVKEGEDGLVGFAAHGFGVCMALRKYFGQELGLGVGDGEVARANTVTEMLERLSCLPETLTAGELKTWLILTLQAIELYLWEKHPDSLVVEGRQELQTLKSAGETVVSGSLHCWMRPTAPALTRLREKLWEQSPGERKPQRPAWHPNRALRYLRFAFEHSEEVTVSPRSTARPAPLRALSPGRDSSGEEAALRVALCPLSCGSHPQFRLNSEGTHFTALPSQAIVRPEQLINHLDAVLEASRKAGVHLVVFPELTIDPPALRHLEGYLRSRESDWLRGLVPGSFHFWLELEAGEQALPVNRSRLHGPGGLSLLEHLKRGLFELPASQVPNSPFFPGNHEPKASKLVELIRRGHELQVLETALGTVVLLICADATYPDAQGMFRRVLDLAPDLVVVVSMSPETRQFEEKLRELADHWIGSLLVNAGCLCDVAGGKAGGADLVLAACDLALLASSSRPNHRWRWRAGTNYFEEFDFHAADKDKPWRKPNQPDQHGGVVSFLGEDSCLGMVVDLGVLLRGLDADPK